MKIYAISDLHLSSDDSKPMNVFGGNWEGHFEKIKADWRKKVTEEDAVLIAGDISWAMKLSGALGDLKGLVPLPGKKIFNPRQSRLLVERHHEAPRQRPGPFLCLFADGRRAGGELCRRRLARVVLSRKPGLFRTGPKALSP